MSLEIRGATPRSIFEAAILLPDDEARQAFVDLCCGENASLKDRVSKLLAAWKRREASPIDAAAQIDLGVTALYEVDEEELVQKQSAAPVTSAPVENLDLATHPQIGPYKLLEQIGQGGMGAVYVAQQSAPVKRNVALKIIKPGMDTREVIARFEAERQALALMDHPNIAKVLDAGTTPRGRPYFAMELVKGETVTDYCDHNRLNLRQRLELFLQVCQAVQHAHQKGIIHRDLKPSNVLIAVHDVTPVAKVIDFGIAKAVGQSLTDKTIYTAMSQLVGTPLYMSPEQAGQSSLDVDTRTDVYALGVLLYELLTGTTPIDPETMRKVGLDELRRIIREDEPPLPSARMSTLKAAALSTVADKRAADPRRLARQVRGELDWVVMKCLEKDRNRRYESASALAADVQRYLSDEPVTACPPSAAYRLRKFVRRNRSRVAVAGAALVVALLVAITGGWLYLERIGEQDRTSSGVRESLAGAQAAIEAEDLNRAAQRVAEARGRLGPDTGRLGNLAAEVNRFGNEVEARRADEDRFQRFLKLASEGQDSMYGSIGRRDDRVADQALELYAVLTSDDWLSVLDKSYLTAAKKQQIREVAYVTLVSLADESVRWSVRVGTETRAIDPQRSRDLLRRAESFHEPTRAFYFVRSRCNWEDRDLEAMNADAKRYQEMTGKTAWDYFLPGHTAGWDGDLDEAIRSYETALRIQPDHYNSLFYLANRLATDKINRLPEAIEVLRACIALRPNEVWPYFDRAEWHEKLNQIAEAEADLTAAFNLSSNGWRISQAYRRRHDIWQRRGDVERERKVLEAETAQLKAFIERNPQDAPAHHRLGNVLHDTGPPDEELACWRKVTELDPTSDIGHNNLGTLLNANGLTDQAIASYRKAIENNLAYSTAYTNLGNALGKIGRTDEAIGCYRKAIETNANNVQAYVNLAYHLNQKGLADEVMTYARKAIELEPKNEQAHYSLGLALDKKGLHEQAIPVWRQAIEINPKSVLAHNELASDLHEMARQTGDKGLLDEAIGSCRKAIELNPKSAVAHNNIACALEDKGLWEEAIASYRRAIDLAPTEVVGLRNFASLLANCPDLQYRDPDQAMTLARKCIELAPNDAHVLTLLGTVHYRLGEFKAAQTALDKAMAMTEGVYSLWFLLAMTHWQLGEKDLAVSCYQEGVERMESKDSTRRHDARLIVLRAEAAVLLQRPPMMPPIADPPQQQEP